MGIVITKFIYSSIDEALNYSSYYSDLLSSYKNTYESSIWFDGEHYTLEYKIYGPDSRRKDSSRDCEGTGYLPEPSTENS